MKTKLKKYDSYTKFFSTKNRRINFKKLLYLVTYLVVFNNCIRPSDANRDLNSLLVNDLNIIATKIDEIPETILNLKLVLIADECNDIKLNWKINQNKRVISKAKSNIVNALKKNQVDNAKNTNIFGYQVVVREYLEVDKSSQKSQYLNDDSPQERTLRVYSSKFIDSKQNKFKLINLLRKDKASYHICLIIYIDVTETVAFEKQCVNFSLPISSSGTSNTEESEACQNKKKTSIDKKSGKITTAISSEIVSSTLNYNSSINMHTINTMEKEINSESAAHSKLKFNKTINSIHKQVTNLSLINYLKLLHFES